MVWKRILGMDSEKGNDVHGNEHLLKLKFCGWLNLEFCTPFV